MIVAGNNRYSFDMLLSCSRGYLHLFNSRVNMFMCMLLAEHF